MAYAVARKALASHHGWLDIPIEMYLDKDDYGYELHYVPILDKDGKPTGEYQLNPFHTHFIHPDIETVTSEKIEEQMVFHLPNFYEAWKAGKTIRSGWDTNTRKSPIKYDREMSKEQLSIRYRLIAKKVKELALVSKIVISEGGKTFPATAIDVGSPATNRASASANTRTIILAENPANDTGILDSVEIWAATNATGCKVGTFYGSSTTYTSRDYELLGNVAQGSKQTFTGLSIDVVASDLIGFYIASGNIERDNSGYLGYYYSEASSDYFDGASHSYTYSGTYYTCSLYATGDTGGWANIAKINGIAAGDIAKINGIAVADIAKINGVAV